MEDGLSVEDVMQDLEVGRNTAYKIFARNDFPAIRLGKKFWVQQEAYQEWKKKRRIKEE